MHPPAQRSRQRAFIHPRLLVGVFVVALLGSMGFGWLSTEREVRLVVDGEVIATRTHARTVGELLERVGLPLAAVDVVEPPAHTEVVDDMTVRVLPAEASAQPASATSADLPLEARRALPARAARGSHERALMAARSPRLVRVTLAADGRTRTVLTPATTVAELLERAGVEVGAQDRVSPAPETALERGLVITVQRVAVTTETRAEPIAHKTVEQAAPDLPAGQRSVATEGRDGLREITEQVVRVDGAEESRSVVSDEVVRAPVDEVVRVGTAEPAAPEPTVAETPVTMTAPAPPSEAPEPAPEEAPPPVRSEEGGASWYDNPGGGLTAAHRTLPRGTTVTVTNLATGASVRVTINDRGPFVRGRIIDLNREAFSQIAPLGAGVVRVRIEW